MLNRLRFIHVVTLMIFGIAAWLVHAIMSDPAYADTDLRIQVAAAVMLAFTSGYSYWLGSTNSSARKTELLSPEKQK